MPRFLNPKIHGRRSWISTEKTTVKKSKKVARCFQNTSLYHYINYRLFATSSYVWECIFMKIMDYEVNGWIHCRICSKFLSFRPHQSLPCPYAQRLCSTTSRPPESGINGTNSPKFHQYMPKRIRKIVAWLGVKEFNDMSLGRILILQTGSFHLSKLQPHMKCASPHLSWLFWKTTWASSANLGIQKHGLLKGAVSISMVQMMIVSISWKLNCWFLPFLWLNHCLDSGSMASLYLKYNMTCHRTAEARPIHGNQQIPRPFNNSQVNDLASVFSPSNSQVLENLVVFPPIFSQGIRTPVPRGASGRVEQDILPCNNVEQQNWGCKKWTKKHKIHGIMLVGDTNFSWFQGIKK